MTTCRLSEMMAPSFYDVHRRIRAGGIDELVAKGGRGSTKSSFVSLELILLLLKHPDCHAVVMRRYQNRLRRSVYPQICWAIAELRLSSRFHCTVSPMECTYLPTGQKILFFGLDDPGKLKSIKVPFGYIGIAWFEELDQFAGPEQIRNAEQSLFRGGSFSFAFKSFNPPAAARNWANRYVLENRPGRLVHQSDYRSVPTEWLGPRFLADAEHLRTTDLTAYRHDYLGEVVGSGTAVFENLKIEPIPQEKKEQFERLYMGIDWGFYPDIFAWNRMCFDPARCTLYVFDELSMLRASNRQTAEAIMKKGVGEDELIVADSAEPKSISDYREMGLYCRGVKKGPGSVEYRMKWLQSLACIWIDPVACPDTAKEFNEYEYERDAKTGEVLPGYPDVDNHHIDAVSYGTFPIWKRRGQ